jgi:uncharacterized membrane protein
MESRLKVAGNPIYPMLVMFPLGLLFTGAIFDAARILSGFALLGTVGYWHIVAALIGGTAAGLAGMVDLFATRDGSRARRLGVTYALLNLAVLFLYVVILVARIGHPDRAAGGGMLAVEFVVLVAATLAAVFARDITDRAAAGLPLVPLPKMQRPPHAARLHAELRQPATVRLPRPTPGTPGRVATR